MDFNNINDSINQFINYTFINEKILDDDSNNNNSDDDKSDD